jgi:hypothetical protein
MASSGYTRAGTVLGFLGMKSSCVGRFTAEGAEGKNAEAPT